MKIWILSAAIPEGATVRPCYPLVFSSEAEATERFRQVMAEEWQSNGPSEDNDGNPVEMPSDPLKAHDLIRANIADGHGEPWGEWELTCHEIGIVQDDEFAIKVTEDRYNGRGGAIVRRRNGKSPTVLCSLLDGTSASLSYAGVMSNHEAECRIMIERATNADAAIAVLRAYSGNGGQGNTYKVL